MYAAASTTTSAPAYAARSSTAASTAARRTATTSASAYSTPAPGGLFIDLYLNLRFGLVNAINANLRLEMCLVCGRNL